MSKQLYLAILLLAGSICSGQNLVPNGNFEQHSACPTAFNQLYYATNWINPTGWTPDYYHKCGIGNVSVPNNGGGFQNALSDSAYAGIFLYSASPDVREFIETPLTDSLIAGSCYYFEMYINLLDNSKYSARNIGVLFSDTLINYSSSLQIIPLTPQLVNSNVGYPDTIGWYQVSGNYIASGGESYIVIGNFNDDLNTPVVLVNPSGLDYAVVYIDDVTLTPCIPTSIGESKNEMINIYPNPFSNQIIFEFSNNEEARLTIYDIFSREVFQQMFVGTTTLITEPLSKGIYIYELKSRNGSFKQGKIVKD